MRILAVIPARGGSKAVPRKNLHPLAGRPLIAYTVEAALKARGLDRIVISTDDDDIAELGRSLGAEAPFRRPAELAEDDTPTRPVLAHAVDWLLHNEGYRAEAVMTLQPTSPLRRAQHIDAAIARFSADPRAESLVSCRPVPHNFHPRSVMREDEQGYLRPYRDEPWATRRQDKEPLFARNGPAICITRTDCLARFVFGGRLLRFDMDWAASIDIDDLDDFARAEQILAGGGGAETG